MPILQNIRQILTRKVTLPSPISRIVSVLGHPVRTAQRIGKATANLIANPMAPQNRRSASVLRIASAPLIASGVASRTSSTVSALGRGFTNVARFLAPSFTPKIVGTRALSYLGAVTAYRTAKALQTDNPNFQAFFPTAGQVAGSVAVGIFPPTALAGSLVGKGEKNLTDIGKSVSNVVGSFTPEANKWLDTWDFGRTTPLPDVSVQGPTYYAGSPTLTAPSSSTVVSVGGDSGGGQLGQVLLYSLLAGGLGYAIGRRRKKRKRYKGRKHRK